jgi:SHS2 domain-containing protein
MKKYKLLNHTADIRVEVWGKTRKELFGNAVSAMFDLMVSMPGEDETKPLDEKTIKVTGNDLEDTLINFLREVLYLFNGDGWVVGHCKIMECSTKRLVAQLMGEPFNKKKHSIKTEIKAVTYSGLSIKKTKPGWQAKVVFDV